MFFTGVFFFFPQILVTFVLNIFNAIFVDVFVFMIIQVN